MSSKVITLKSDNTTTVEDASIGDIFTSLYNRDVTVTGTYGILKDIALFTAGDMVGNYVHTGSAFRFRN